MQVAQSGTAQVGVPPVGVPIPSLATVPQFVAKHPAMTEGQIRWALFNSDSNGLKESGAIVRFGRRLLLNEEKFFAWLLSGQRHQQAGQRAA